MKIAKQQTGFARNVTQICNLLYRRFSICKVAMSRTRVLSNTSTASIINRMRENFAKRLERAVFPRFQIRASHSLSKAREDRALQTLRAVRLPSCLGAPASRRLVERTVTKFAGVTPALPGSAFSLIELMVAVSLMTLIVLGLVVMFSQTQKAFRASLTQTDLLEAGRIQTDMMARELSQIAASGRGFTTNFFVELSSRFNPPLLQGMTGTSLAPGVQDQRTNIVQSFFFLSQNNQNWTGTGYVVIPDGGLGVGTLYRFYTNQGMYSATNMSGDFLKAPLSSLTRISDGVVHLRVRPFATNGYPIVWDGFRTNGVFKTNAFNTGALRVKSTIAYNPLPSVPEAVNCYFTSNALPAYLELEVGILEKQVLERFRAIGSVNALAQQRYLSNHVGQVHIFRQRIPIRTVDFSAYQ